MSVDLKCLIDDNFRDMESNARFKGKFYVLHIKGTPERDFDADDKVYGIGGEGDQFEAPP